MSEKPTVRRTDAGDTSTYIVHNGCDHATVFLREWERADGSYAGMLVAHSTFGAYAYTWGHMGSPLRRFLCSLGIDYAMTKLAGDRAMVFDHKGTVEACRGFICEQRRTGLWDRDLARETWDAVGELPDTEWEFMQGIEEIEALRAGVYDGHFYRKTLSPQCVGFWSDIFQPLAAHLKTELA